MVERDEQPDDTVKASFVYKKAALTDDEMLSYKFKGYCSIPIQARQSCIPSLRAFFDSLHEWSGGHHSLLREAAS